MKLLILGGTGTIGREIVYQALERGHHVTVLSRGMRQAAFDKDVQMVCGDRRDEETMQNLVRKVRPEVVMDLGLLWRKRRKNYMQCISQVCRTADFCIIGCGV